MVATSLRGTNRTTTRTASYSRTASKHLGSLPPPSCFWADAGPPTTRTRKRDSSLCVGLPDTHKAAHKNRCAVEMRKQVFAVGNAVQARWGGAKGKAWYAGTVTGVSELSAEQGGPAWTYDIQYNDGDHDQGLKAQYVRA